MPANVAVLLAAGTGTRMGSGGDKALLPLLGEPVLAWSLRAFDRAAGVDEILVVTGADRVADYAGRVVPACAPRRPWTVIAGGETRHASERRAVAWLAARIERGEVGVVLIHDAARPLVTPRLVEGLVAAASAFGAALPATAAAPDEVIVRVGGDGSVEGVLPATRMWFAQTPQAFDGRRLLDAFRRAAETGFEGTDTAACLEHAGGPVRLVEGDPDNLKVTYPGDVERAAAILGRRRGPPTGR